MTTVPNKMETNKTENKTFRPQTLKEAVVFRRDAGAIPFLGGTDLMVRYRGYSGTLPKLTGPVLFLDAVKELHTLRQDGKTLVIGAAVTYADFLSVPDLPWLLYRAVEEIAAPGIRNRGTVAGNICNASPAGDVIPPLYVHEASVELARADAGGAVETRTLPIGEFFRGPGKTVLQPDELMTAVHIPHLPEGQLYYRKVGTRKANALSKLSAAGYARVEGGEVRDFRFALGAVAPTVARVTAAENLIIGRKVDSLLHAGSTGTAASDILSAAEQVIRPIDDQRSTAQYRRNVALNALTEFLEQIVRKTQEQRSEKGAKT